MKTHALKCLQPWFDEVDSGRKTFELRLNDRRFQVGDVLLLWEWDPENGGYTNSGCIRKITSILGADGPMPPGDGLAAGYVVLSLARLTAHELQRLGQGKQWSGNHG